MRHSFSGATHVPRSSRRAVLHHSKPRNPTVAHHDLAHSFLRASAVVVLTWCTWHRPACRQYRKYFPMLLTGYIVRLHIMIIGSDARLGNCGEAPTMTPSKTRDNLPISRGCDWAPLNLEKDVNHETGWHLVRSNGARCCGGTSNQSQTDSHFAVSAPT